MKTNVKLESLELFKHADQRVAIIVVNNKPGFNERLEVFLTNDALAAWLKEKREANPSIDFRYVEDYLGVAVNYAIWNDVEGISLHSVTDAAFDVTREDLTKLAELFDAFGVMNSLKKGRMSMAEAADILKHKTIYYIGDEPREGKIEKKDMVYGKTLLGESIAVFMTKEGALQYAGIESKVPISSCKLVSLSSATNHEYSVIIEPERLFSIQLPAEALID